MKRSLLISVCLHGALILLFLIHKSAVLKKDSKRDAAITEVEVVEVVGVKHSSLGTKSSMAGLPSRKQLMSGIRFSRSDEENGVHFGLGPGSYDNPLSKWGSGSGEFNRIGQLSLMTKIQRQMDNLLYYPSVLVRHKIEGTVNARLVLNNLGECDWQETQISSSNLYFRVFVLDLLKTLCKNKWDHEVAGRRLTNVDLSFSFAITEHDDLKIKEENKRVVGNVILFYTNAQRSVAEWNIGPFKGLFPIPTISIDFDWLKENWERIREKQDPYKEFREHTS